MRRHAFTFVELLIIIGIMAVLVALLFPVFFRPHGHGHPTRSACQSNLKQIALGLKAYVQDYDEKFPLSFGNRIAADAGFGWAGSIQPYLKSVQILQCPTETTSATSTTTTATRDFTDYFYNARLATVSETNLDYISNTILNGDYNSGDATSSASNTITWSATGPYATRHLDGSNFSFADGHVKWLKPTVPSMAPANSNIFTFATRGLPAAKRPTTRRKK